MDSGDAKIELLAAMSELHATMTSGFEAAAGGGNQDVAVLQAGPARDCLLPTKTEC